MQQSEHLRNQAKALISFGSQASSTGLSYLEANAYQEKINEADREAKEKVLKEELTKAEILGRQVAARNPKMSVMEEVIALKENVGLTMENPNYQEIMKAMNEGFLLRKAEVGLARIDADIKNNATNLGEEIYESFLEAQEDREIEGGPPGRIEEGFKGNLTQYAAEHIEKLRVATISNLVNWNNKENRFGVVLAKPGNSINYDPVLSSIAKKQNELDDHERYKIAFDDAQENIHNIVFSGNDHNIHPRDKNSLKKASSRLSGKSLSRVIEKLRKDGISKNDINKIVFTSLRSGLETEVENQGIEILNTNYFSNLINILHDKTTDPTSGLSLFMKDTQAGNQLIEKINQKRNDLENKFEKQINKKTETKENVLAGNAIVALSTALKKATELNISKGEIKNIINKIYIEQGPGGDYEGFQYLNPGTRTLFMSRFEALYDLADADTPQVTDEDIEKVLGEANGKVSDIINKLSAKKLNEVNSRSSEKQFNEALDGLENNLNDLASIEDTVIEELKYGWNGESGWNTKIDSAKKEIRNKIEKIVQYRVDGTNQNTRDGVIVQFDAENREYKKQILDYLIDSDPKLTNLISEAEELTISTEDRNRFNAITQEFYGLINKTLLEPSISKSGMKILKADSFAYGKETRRNLIDRFSSIQKIRSNKVQGKIQINEKKQTQFELGIDRKMTNLMRNNEGATNEKLIKITEGYLADTQNAFENSIIGQPAYSRIKKYLEAGITDRKSIIDKNYGQLKVFNDSTKSIRNYVLGEASSGLELPIQESQRHMFESMLKEHKALQDHLMDVSENFSKKTIVFTDPNKESIKVSQAGMFLTGTSIYNKRIREKAFSIHRNLMLNLMDKEHVDKEISNMKQDENKWSPEEVQIIEAVSNFESKGGRLEILRNAYKKLRLAANNKQAREYTIAGIPIAEGVEEEKAPDIKKVDVSDLLISPDGTNSKQYKETTQNNEIDTNLNQDNAPDMETIENNANVDNILENVEDINEVVEPDETLLGPVEVP